MSYTLAMPRMEIAEPRLPPAARWFFVAAPPVLCLLFDPHCLNTVDNVSRAWLSMTFFSAVTGLAVHHGFEWIGPLTTRRSRLVRFIADGLVTSGIVSVCSLALFGVVRWIYPEIGDDVAGVWWRTMLIAVVYLIAARFAQMLLQQAIAERLRSQRERTTALEAKLSLLRARLEPHFLFNTLNVCAGLVHASPDTAESMIDKLSGFLRYTLESDSERLVPVAKELEATRAYLDIQKVRFGDRLQYAVDFDQTSAPNLPSLILQPLVENAFVHGINGERGGMIRIQGGPSGSRFRISIEDSGGGTSRPSSGIGQQNVRERLNLTFGGAAELICQRTASGYSSTLWLPIEPNSPRPHNRTLREAAVG